LATNDKYLLKWRRVSRFEFQTDIPALASEVLCIQPEFIDVRSDAFIVATGRL